MSEGHTGDRNTSWKQNLADYNRLSLDRDYDTEYILRVGIHENVLRLAGDCARKRVLDVGCGTGWLLQNIDAEEGFECDLSYREAGNPKAHFSIQDVCSLTYDNQFFDLVVASLVLHWVDDLKAACRQLHRVTRIGGTLLVASVHPYFYRTGEVVSEGKFLISEDLSRPKILSDHLISHATQELEYRYRPPDHYLNALIQAGWSLSYVEDWFLEMQGYRNHTSDRPNKKPRTGQVPMFWFLKCERKTE